MDDTPVFLLGDPVLLALLPLLAGLAVLTHPEVVRRITRRWLRGHGRDGRRRTAGRRARIPQVRGSRRPAAPTLPY